MINKYQLKTILDAPCGDYNWFRLVERGNHVKYIGGDIVEPLIEKNNECYSSDNTAFIVLDICNDKLPQADMWLCRDCLFHLSHEDIRKVIKNFLSSEVPYLLTSIHTKCTANKDIFTGNFRLLNLELPPFNFCQPILYIDDWIEGFPERKLGLWSKEMLEKVKLDL